MVYIYIPTWMVDFCGINAGKYVTVPWIRHGEKLVQIHRPRASWCSPPALWKAVHAQNICFINHTLGLYLALSYLGGGFEPTHLKNMQPSNWIISPSRGENKAYLKPPPSYLVTLEHNNTMGADWGCIVTYIVFMVFILFFLGATTCTKDAKDVWKNSATSAKPLQGGSPGFHTPSPWFHPGTGLKNPTNATKAKALGVSLPLATVSSRSKLRWRLSWKERGGGRKTTKVVVV